MSTYATDPKAWRVMGWVQRHRTLARVVARLRPGLLDRLVWRELERDQDFMASMREGEAYFAAGRFYRWDPETGETTPNPDWPKEGPQPR